jgi:hypothetical protein
MAKSKKKSKSFLPKKIGGVRVPKSVRKGRFGELLASRRGQALIAEALLGAGAVAAGLKAKDEPKVRHAVHDAKAKLAHAGDGAGRDLHLAGGGLAYALGEAARSFAEALRRHDGGQGAGGQEPRSFAGAEAEAAWQPYGGEPATAAEETSDKKQSTAYEAGPL